MRAKAPANRLFPAILLLFAWAVLAPVSPSLADSGCGLLWRVETPAGDSYLFGTVHSEDARVLELSEPADRAFEVADAFIMEMIPDLGAMTALVKAMHYQDQRNLRSELEEDLYRKVVEALAERGVGEGLAVKMKPWAVAVSLSFPMPESGMFLDMALYNRALRDGKTTEGLESVEEQLAFFRGLGHDEEIALLEAALDGAEHMEVAMQRLIEAYLERDPDRMMSLNREYLSELPEPLAQRFRRQAIIQRNHVMAERLAPHLEEGGVFAAVGALHLYGEEGLVSLLRERGYAVECEY